MTYFELFGEEPKILASFTKDTAENYQEGLLELYKKIRPGEPLAVDSAESLITSMFFDARRYDLAKVGRYKFNKKLLLRNRVKGQTLAEEVVSTVTGEVIAEAGTVITRELADTISVGKGRGQFPQYQNPFEYDGGSAGCCGHCPGRSGRNRTGILSRIGGAAGGERRGY